MWYKKLGLIRRQLDTELRKLKVSIKGLNEDLVDGAANAALRHGKEFLFRYHARGYIIGATALMEKATLITHNTQRFDWLTREGVAVKTPEDFISENL